MKLEVKFEIDPATFCPGYSLFVDGVKCRIGWNMEAKQDLHEEHGLDIEALLRMILEQEMTVDPVCAKKPREIADFMVDCIMNHRQTSSLELEEPIKVKAHQVSLQPLSGEKTIKEQLS